MGKSLAVILVLLILVGVAITSTTDRQRADFRFVNQSSINTLDTAQLSYGHDTRLALNLWEGLTVLDPQTLEPREGVARLPAALSSDRRTYTFTLRPDARWSNGDPVTAQDFVRAWRRVIEPGSADVYAEMVQFYIEGADAYAVWRMESTSLLGLVRQLQRSSPISAKSAASGLNSELGRVLAAKVGLDLRATLPADDDPFWPRTIERLEATDADWKKLGDELLDAHIAEIDARWSRVGLRIVDEHHLEVRLVRPTPFFLELTAFSTYLPTHESIEILREHYEGRPLTDAGLWTYDAQWTKPDYHRAGYPGLITNGAYRLAEWEFKRGVWLAANPHYWRADEVRSKTVQIVDVEYANASWMLYEQGHLDYLCELTMDFTPELVRQARDGLRSDIHTTAAFGTYFYNLNCRPQLWDARPNPLADARVRRALALAVNKSELVEYVLRLGNPVANGLVPAGQIPGYPSPDGLPYDPPRARRELAEAGYPQGRGLPTIEILYNTGANHEPKAQAIKRMWEKELGISCLLVGKEVKTFAEDLMNGRFMVSRLGWFGDFRDPTTFLNLSRSTDGHNHPGFSDPAYDAMLEAAAAEPNEQERLRMLARAERYLVEEQVPILPLYTYVTVFAWRPEVTGIYLNARSHLPLYHAHVQR